jgi:hypothetical protein
MATFNSSKLSAQQEVVDIAERLLMIAAQLAGFKPTVGGLLEDVDKDVGDSLVMLAGMADYVQIELGMIGERLTAITQEQHA